METSSGLAKVARRVSRSALRRLISSCVVLRLAAARSLSVLGRSAPVDISALSAFSVESSRSMRCVPERAVWPASVAEARRMSISWRDALAQRVELVGHRQFQIGELAADGGELRQASTLRVALGGRRHQRQLFFQLGDARRRAGIAALGADLVLDRIEVLRRAGPASWRCHRRWRRAARAWRAWSRRRRGDWRRRAEWRAGLRLAFERCEALLERRDLRRDDRPSRSRAAGEHVGGEQGDEAAGEAGRDVGEEAAVATRRRTRMRRDDGGGAPAGLRLSPWSPMRGPAYRASGAVEAAARRARRGFRLGGCLGNLRRVRPGCRRLPGVRFWRAGASLRSP